MDGLTNTPHEAAGLRAGGPAVDAAGASRAAPGGTAPPWAAAAPRPRVDGGRIVTVLAGFAAVAVVWALIALALAMEHRRAVQGALRDTAALALTLQEGLDRRIEAIDARLRFAQALHARDPAGFAFGPWAGIDPGGRDLVQGLVVGPDGVARLTGDGPLAAPVDASGRADVRVNLDGPPGADTLFIGEPVPGRAMGRWVLAFSRPLRGGPADGATAGVVVLGLDASALSRPYEALAGEGVVVAVVGLDGVVRARLPNGEDHLGRSLPPELLRAFRGTEGATQVSFRRESPVDGVDRFVTLRRLQAGGGQPPLLVFVGLEARAALAGFHEDRRRLLGLGVAIGALIALAAALVEQRRASGRRARARLEALVEHLAQGVLMVDAAGRIAVANARAVALLGLPPGLAAPGRPVAELLEWQIASGEFAGDPDETLRARLLATLRPGPGGTYERTRPDGTVLEVRTEAMPDGGLVRTFTDVTARRRARDALAAARDAALAAEAALAAAIENMPQGILMVGADRRVKVINRRAARMLSLPPGLARPGVHVRAILDWQVQNGRYLGDPHALADALRGMAAERVEPACFERRTPEGRLLEVRTVPLPDGGGVRSYTDVTERRRQEQALEDAHAATLAAEAALSAAIENVPQGIMQLSPEGRVRVMNREAARLTGLPEELTRPGTDPDARRAWRRARGEPAPWPEAAAPPGPGPAGGGGCPPRHEYARPDGTVVEVRTVTLRDGGAVRSLTDVTERRRAEREMAAARDAAEAGARARAEFLAVMGHEVRTPLNAVIGLSGLLQDASLPPEQTVQARLIRAAGDRLLALVNDILDFSSLESGRFALERTPFDPRAEATAAVGLLEPQARAKGLRLLTEASPAVPARVAGDPGRLRQVLLILLDNAVRFTEAGGSVTLSVDRLPAEGAEVRLGFAVRDTGSGIPAEVLPHLFSARRQVDASTSRRFGGTGLGLALGRQLVERMGGTIGVDSAPGEGSTFRFDVRLAPAAPPGAAPAAAAWPARPAEGAAAAGEEASPRLRVLLAEDNGTNRLVLTHRLHQLGHRVDAVGDGLEALEAVRARPYDLVVMDMMMPRMDGLEATRAIRALPGPESRLPIIGLTAAATPEDEAACLAAGMNGYERKPIGTERLRAAVATAAALRGAAVAAEQDAAAAG